MTAADAVTLAHLRLDIAWVYLSTMVVIHVAAPVIRHILDRRRPSE